MESRLTTALYLPQMGHTTFLLSCSKVLHRYMPTHYLPHQRSLTLESVITTRDNVSALGCLRDDELLDDQLQCLAKRIWDGELAQQLSEYAAICRSCELTHQGAASALSPRLIVDLVPSGSVSIR